MGKILSLPLPGPTSIQLIAPSQQPADVKLLASKTAFPLLKNTGGNKLALVRRLFSRRFFVSLVKRLKNIRRPALAIILILVLAANR